MPAGIAGMEGLLVRSSGITQPDLRPGPNILISYSPPPLPLSPGPPQFLTAFKWMMSIWCSEDDINKGTVEPLQGTLSGIHALCAAVQRRQQASLMLVSSPSMLTSTPRQINQLSTAIQLQLSVISMRDLTRIISEVTTLTQGLLTIYRAFLEPQRPQGRADSRGGSGSAKRRHQPLEAAMVVRCAVPCLAVLLDYALRTQLIHAGFGGALSSGEGAAENAAIIHAELCSVLAMLHVCVQLCWPWSEALIPTSVARELHGILHDCLRLQTLHAGKRIAVLILMFLHGVCMSGGWLLHRVCIACP